MLSFSIQRQINKADKGKNKINNNTSASEPKYRLYKDDIYTEFNNRSYVIRLVLCG